MYPRESEEELMPVLDNGPVRIHYQVIGTALQASSFRRREAILDSGSMQAM